MTVPPVYPSKKAPWPWIVAIFALGLCVVFVAFAFLGSSMKNGTRPPMRVGAGQPSVIKVYDDGWNEVSLPEIPMRLMMPGTPALEALRFKPGSIFEIRGWTAYRSHSARGWEGIVGTWYRHPEKLDLSQSIDALKTSWATTSAYENFEGHTRPLKIGSVDGRELEATYRQGKWPMHSLLFLWQRNDATFYVSVRHYDGHRESDFYDLQRIVGSIEYR